MMEKMLKAQMGGSSRSGTVIATAISGSATRKAKLDSLYSAYNALSDDDKLMVGIRISHGSLLRSVNKYGGFTRTTCDPANSTVNVEQVVLDNNNSSYYITGIKSTSPIVSPTNKSSDTVSHEYELIWL